MHKFLIIALFFVAVVAKGQEPITYLSGDSITYQYYQAGEWDKLIEKGNQAIKQNIDYKRLRQRMGYAYFVKADFYGAQMQYEKALAFDASDANTRAYLYYCGLYTGNSGYARFHAEKLPKEVQRKLKEDAFKPVDEIDFEYNYKANNVLSRSNPTYLRMGISTQLGYRLMLYQSISNYQQTINSSSLTKQPEYFALLNLSVTSHTSLDVAYHYLNTSIGGVLYPGNMLFTAFSTSVNRFSFGFNGSVLNSNLGNTKQFGLNAGVTLPGRSNIYFNSSLISMIETNNNRILFSQVAGARLYKKVWAEGNIVLGNLKNYSAHNALYVYNSIDPTTFRTGFTLFWYPGKSVTLFGNYTYDKKRIVLTSFDYNQYSFSGGIIWKL